MTKSGGAVHAFRLPRKSTTKATDHELQKYDIFTRYGHRAISLSLNFGRAIVWCEHSIRLDPRAAASVPTSSAPIRRE